MTINAKRDPRQAVLSRHVKQAAMVPPKQYMVIDETQKHPLTIAARTAWEDTIMVNVAEGIKHIKASSKVSRVGGVGPNEQAHGIASPCCRLGEACTQHKPKKTKPFIPSVDEWDLLPDA